MLTKDMVAIVLLSQIAKSIGMSFCPFCVSMIGFVCDSRKPEE